jgi:hypothetical protein
VADRGPGLALAAPRRAEPGHGLGLVLVRRVVASFAGRAWAESRAGGGAVFGVRLPAAADRHAGQATAAVSWPLPRSRGAGRGPRQQPRTRRGAAVAAAALRGTS